MELRELQALYEQACANVGRGPDADQFVAWERVLLGYPRADVRQALNEWWADCTPIEWFGTTRGKGSLMPTPADLLPVILRMNEQRREAKTFKPCHQNGCTCGGRKRIRVGPGVFDFDIVPCECRLAWEAAHGKQGG
jgi:hypothetical protein